MKNDLDFARWADLAATDGAEFERKRHAVLEAYIGSQPAEHRQRLRQLQWKIDAVRRVSPNPLASCVRICDLMMERAYGEGGLVEALQSLVTGEPRTLRREKCQVLRLPPSL